MRLPIRDFATMLGIETTTISNWKSGLSAVRLRANTQAILDTAYAQRATPQDRERFEQIVAEGEDAWRARHPKAARRSRSDSNAVERRSTDLATACESAVVSTDLRQARSNGYAVPKTDVASIGRSRLVGVDRVASDVLDVEEVSALMRTRAAPGSLRSFATVTDLLAGQRQSLAPDALIGPIEAHRDAIASLFRAASDDVIKRRAGALLGETSVVASRVWSAIGDRSMALTHAAFARKLADQLQDKTLGGIARIFESNLRSDAATLISSDGDVVIGLRVLNEADSLSASLPPAARARIGAEQAQAYAVLDLRDECEDALTRAQCAAESIDDDDRSGLFSDWNRTRIQVYVGTCQLLLGQPKRAIAALVSALASPELDSPNVALAARVDLASAYALSGELDEGCRVLGETYEDLAAMGNRRGLERAQCALDRLAPWHNEKPVLALMERVGESSA
ncbi:XRE family transcriptional regulator [Nocardia thailandica]|uniref:XRE family transcriptional regulator n=1 Tax=Nocardia thailandica TaxID=257275 RepID=UPI0012FCC418|nr:XRE family transcriptional regulator [Nocardia thailandica]